MTLWEFQTCRSLEFFREKDPIISRHWLLDVANAFHTSNCHDRENVRLASYIVKDRARDWWGEVGRAIGDEVVDSMTWDDFVTRF